MSLDTARCPNRAATVRAHNWVVLGALLPRPSQPALFLPHAGRLYFRRSQLPAGEAFHTKCELLVQLLRCEATHVSGRHLGVFNDAEPSLNGEAARPPYGLRELSGDDGPLADDVEPLFE